MNAFTPALSAFTPHALAVLRIVASLLVMAHGTQKLFGFPTPLQGMPPVLSLLWIGACIELVGGTMLLVGWRTREVAFVLAGEIAAAYWLFHAPRNFFPAANGGDAAIFFCFIFLYFVFSGPGTLGFDNFNFFQTKRSGAGRHYRFE